MPELKQILITGLTQGEKNLIKATVASKGLTYRKWALQNAKKETTQTEKQKD